MAYSPGQFKGDSSYPPDILSYLERELTEISRSQAETDAVDLRPVHREPKRPREGMLVSADGVDWDPGGGKGVYSYQNGAWVKL